jgi:type VI secretion system secreted protein Hcp
MPVDIFAKLGNIAGESADAKHKDEIEVLSFSWGVSNTAQFGPGTGVGAGKATFRDLSIVHRIDKASPLLMKACATGQHLPQATISQRKAGASQKEYLIIKLNDVVITNVAFESAPAEGTESVSMTFAKVHFEYKPFKSNGTLGAGIDFKYDLQPQKEG